MEVERGGESDNSSETRVELGRDRLFLTERPRTGLLISTFAAAPYVHLTLESRRRFFPDVPVLAWDDGSGACADLRALCRGYGVEFGGNPRRFGWEIGDLAAYVRGLEWASGAGLELLVKMSRRFVVVKDWVPELQRLAWTTQYATYSNGCGHFGYGFRSECAGFHVGAWRDGGGQEALQRALFEARIAGRKSIFVERLLHDAARSIHRRNCPANREYELLHPRPKDADAYGPWPLLGENRRQKRPGALWHDSDSPEDYAAVARGFGLNYRARDFADPNQGFG